MGTGASVGEDAAMEEAKEEWDGPWKEALDDLASVFGLFWPDVAGEVDLDKGWTSLEQELQKLTPDGSSGLLRVDKLFELAARGSGDPRLAHFEAQMAVDPELPWRMFRYGRRASTSTSPSAGSPSSATTTPGGSPPTTAKASWVARTPSRSASPS